MRRRKDYEAIDEAVLDTIRQYGTVSADELIILLPDIWADDITRSCWSLVDRKLADFTPEWNIVALVASSIEK